MLRVLQSLLAMLLCIAAFSNQQYYHGRLITRARAPCRPPCGFRWPSYDAVCFIDAFVPGEQRDRTSVYNAQEASAIADAFFRLHDGGDVSHVKSWLFRFTRDNLEKFVQLCNIVVGASER